MQTVWPKDDHNVAQRAGFTCLLVILMCCLHCVHIIIILRYIMWKYRSIISLPAVLCPLVGILIMAVFEVTNLFTSFIHGLNF